MEISFEGVAGSASSNPTPVVFNAITYFTGIKFQEKNRTTPNQYSTKRSISDKPELT
jgi:hypothetical protein